MRVNLCASDMIQLEKLPNSGELSDHVGRLGDLHFLHACPTLAQTRLRTNFIIMMLRVGFGRWAGHSSVNALYSTAQRRTYAIY